MIETPINEFLVILSYDHQPQCTFLSCQFKVDMRARQQLVTTHIQAEGEESQGDEKHVATSLLLNMS